MKRNFMTRLIIALALAPVSVASPITALRVTLPAGFRSALGSGAGPLWFKVLQTCETGSIDWAQTPASGSSTKGLKTPAALLEVIESGAGGHAH